MLFNAELQVGYYDDDDSYHGPFTSPANIEATSIEDAVRQAKAALRSRMQSLNENQPDGGLLRLRCRGEVVYQGGREIDEDELLVALEIQRDQMLARIDEGLRSIEGSLRRCATRFYVRPSANPHGRLLRQ